MDYFSNWFGEPDKSDPDESADELNVIEMPDVRRDLLS